MNIWASQCRRKKKTKNKLYSNNPPLSSFRTLYILSLGPEGAFWYAPSLLARLYFFIRPSGGCQSPGGCQSTLILIRTWVLSGVNGSQQLSTRLSIPPRLIYHPRRALPTNTRMRARRWGKRLRNKKSDMTLPLEETPQHAPTTYARTGGGSARVGSGCDPRSFQKQPYIKVFWGNGPPHPPTPPQQPCLIFHVSRFTTQPLHRPDGSHHPPSCIFFLHLMFFSYLSHYMELIPPRVAISAPSRHVYKLLIFAPWSVLWSIPQGCGFALWKSSY